MSPQPLLLLGAGGHALACIDVIEGEGRFAIAGLIDAKVAAGDAVLGYSVLGTDDDLRSLVPRFPNALVTVGQIETAAPRRRLFELLRQLGYALPAIVSPRAHVSPHARVGAGTIVMHGAIVNAGAHVGENCILNSRALVEHGATIGDHCHISTGAIVNGDAGIGAGSFVGSGAVVREGVLIGEGCLIGMQQRVLRNCDAGTRMPGKGAS